VLGRLEQITRVLAERETEASALQKELDAERNERTALHARLEELQQKQNQREEIVSRALSENAARLQQLKRELFEREAALTKTRSELEENKTDLEHQRQAYEKQIKDDRQTTGQKIQALNAQILDLQRTQENLKRDVEDRDASNQSLKAQLEESRRNARATEERAANELKNVQNALDDSHRSAAKEIKSLQSALEEAHRNARAVEERLTKEIAGRDQKIHGLEERSMRDRSENERKVAGLNKDIADRDRTIQAFRVEAETLHKELAEHQWAIGDAHTHLEEARQMELKLNEKIAALSQERHETGEKAESLARDVSQRDALLEQSKREIAALKKDVTDRDADLNREREAAAMAAEKSAQEIMDLRTALEAAREKHARELQDLRKTHEQQLQEQQMAASVQEAAVKEKLELSRIENEELRARLSDPDGAISHLERELLQERSERAAMEGKLSVREDLLTRARLELKAFESLEMELQRMRQRCAELEKRLRDK
jgi:chromosome segregation ATPase